MKYLRAVLNETLRMYPPLPFNMRNTTPPVILSSTTRGQPFYLPIPSPCTEFRTFFCRLTGVPQSAFQRAQCASADGSLGTGCRSMGSGAIHR
ncbi:hypothetical protein B0H17DRAFT_1102768 [Mycena rosella]|uniref:Cytochrome P450 n=1 Tax=Mycena rosella TaxID=1033263 RepID=A0AAD7FXU0_MYCRO|nr:hypothetical protein B0H17DRAFT_1102768 [Mycena rosella]